MYFGRGRDCGCFGLVFLSVGLGCAVFGSGFLSVSEGKGEDFAEEEAEGDGESV